MGSNLVGKTITVLSLTLLTGVAAAVNGFSEPHGAGFSFRPITEDDTTVDLSQSDFNFRPEENAPKVSPNPKSTGSQAIDTGDYVFRPPRARRNATTAPAGPEMICPTPGQQQAQQAAPYSGYNYPQQQVYGQQYYQQANPYSGYTYGSPYAPMPGYASPAVPGGYSNPYGMPGGFYPQWPGAGGFGFPSW